MRNTNRTSKITLWASIGVLVFAVIAALIIFLVPGPSDSAAPGNTSSPKPSSSKPADASGVGCKAPASDNRKVPADLRWEATDGISWTASATAGPTRTVDGFGTCFQHSPVGAALAAVTINLSTVDRTQLDIAKFYLADSPGRDTALAQIEPGTYSPIKQQMEDNGMSLVGFRVEEYDKDRAAIRIVLRVPNSSTGFRGIPVPMVWSDGDWKLKLLDDGSTGQPTDEQEGSFTYWRSAGNG